jgi:hypothetical protein
MNQVVWNFSKRIETSQPAAQQGERPSGRFRGGQTAMPGTYTVKLTVDGKVQTKSFTVMKDLF